MSVLVFHEKELCPVWRQASVTVDADVAVAGCDCVQGRPCTGFRIDALPLEARTLQQHLMWASRRMIDRLGLRGYQYSGEEIRVHGPSYSYLLGDRAFDAASPVWQQAIREEDPRHALPFVFEMNDLPPLRDYVLMGRFFAYEHRRRTDIGEKPPREPVGATA